MPRDNTTRPAVSPGLLILLLVLLLGGVQLYFWTDRSMPIDEVSQLLNYPLADFAQAFGPLPEAQQAGPPLFNLLMHAIAGLDIQAMRLVIAALTLAIIVPSLVTAFKWKPLPVAAALFALLVNESFLLNATKLKFYSFDIAGFAVLAAWIYTKDRNTPLRLVDVLLIVAAMVIGISTIVGACVVVGLFLALRLARKELKGREIGLGVLVAIVAFAYYLQISYATELQITAFPDTYSGLGVDAAKKFLLAAARLFQVNGAIILLVVLIVAFAAMMVLRGAARSPLGVLLLFGAASSTIFLALAIIGKYPAVDARHVAWMLGIFAVLAGAVVEAMSSPQFRERRPLATGCTALFVLVLAAIGLREVTRWPPAVTEGATDGIVATLAALPPSTVVNYFGAPRMIPLELARGAPITQHTYVPNLSTRSGAVDPSYFGSTWMEMDADSFSDKIEQMLRDDPAGWAKMVVLLRLRDDYRPLARFVLDAAPRDGRPFYIAALHVAWGEAAQDQRAIGLRQVLDERSCTYAPVVAYEGLLSPGFVLKASCP
ncbi:hypothetical protein P7L70_22385 [Tistrella mobilis]|uniref:hypothetical protein n=1 Tax=Tistrella mobilis TaxID=171437 RepID=UPI0035571FD3